MHRESEEALKYLLVAMEHDPELEQAVLSTVSEASKAVQCEENSDIRQRIADATAKVTFRMMRGLLG